LQKGPAMQALFAFLVCKRCLILKVAKKRKSVDEKLENMTSEPHIQRSRVNVLLKIQRLESVWCFISECAVRSVFKQVRVNDTDTLMVKGATRLKRRWCAAMKWTEERYKAAFVRFYEAHGSLPCSSKPAARA